ncbi:hypothetical protein D3C87_2086870 [compost metagenome]
MLDGHKAKLPEFPNSADPVIGRSILSSSATSSIFNKIKSPLSFAITAGEGGSSLNVASDKTGTARPAPSTSNTGMP